MSVGTDTFERLQRLQTRFGPRVFGKIVQKLLALALYAAGFEYVVERGVQGVDIDAAMPDGRKYAIEVKTTGGEGVSLSEDNIEALKDRSKDGYCPLVAVLRMQMFEAWLFAAIPLRRLRPGPLPVGTLRAYRLYELEAAIGPAFEIVITQHCRGVLSGGEHYLSDVLGHRRG
ncbi:MAG: hypothetical protein ACOC6F_04140 [bacterium]